MSMYSTPSRAALSSIERRMRAREKSSVSSP
jgi:hypothetical protein